MTDDNVIEAEFTAQDRDDLNKLLNENELPKYHTILEVWREVLAPAMAEAGKRVTPAWANSIVTRYPEITFADMEAFRDLYFNRIEELRQLLLEEIRTDEDCLTYSSPEEDRAENAQHYRNMLRVWQQAILAWELGWNCKDPKAGVDMGALAEVHKMFFGETGLVAYLDNIKFEFSEDDQRELAEVLNQQREEAQ